LPPLKGTPEQLQARARRVARRIRELEAAAAAAPLTGRAPEDPEGYALRGMTTLLQQRITSLRREHARLESAAAAGGGAAAAS
jgi:hypothetical protein